MNAPPAPRRVARTTAERIAGTWRVALTCAVVCVATVACGGASRDARPASDLRDGGVHQMSEILGATTSGVGVSGPSVGEPLECSGTSAGLEYYSARWVLDPSAVSADGLISDIGAELEAAGLKLVDVGFESIRPTVLFSDTRSEVSLVTFEETGLIQVSLSTECGTPD